MSVPTPDPLTPAVGVVDDDLEIPVEERAEEQLEHRLAGDQDPVSRGDEVPEADALDQARDVHVTQFQEPVRIDDEVSEADALDQAREVASDDDYDR